jgi:ketosteroid isomerase-like protein
MSDTVPTPSATETCRSVVIAYHRAIDDGDIETAQSYFLDDAVFEARGQRMTGRDEISAFFARRGTGDDQSLHIVSNDVARELSSTEVELDALVLLYDAQASGPYVLNRIVSTRHVLRLSPDGWKVALRAATPLRRAATN